jgi:hypothetical protein
VFGRVISARILEDEMNTTVNESEVVFQNPMDIGSVGDW